MKYFLTFFTLVLLITSTSKVQAQYDTEIDFGLRAKYGFTRFSEIDKKEVESQGGTFDAYTVSFGGFLQLRANHWYFQPELMFSQSITNLGNELGGGQYEYGEYDFTFNSIELPLLLGYRTSFGNVAMRIGAGPMLSYLLGVNGELQLTPNGGGAVEVRDIDDATLDAFNDLTVGARVGIGLDVGSFLFDLKYERSFSKVGEEISTITPVVAGEESSFLLAVGYKLIRTKK